MITLIPLADSPRCRLKEALGRLPRERFCLGSAAGREGTILAISDLLEGEPVLPTGAVPGIPAVFSGQNQAAARFIGKSGLVPLDCGLSLRDTLTLSSLTEGSAMVSLQRPIVGLDGRMVEPVDLPLTLTRSWEPFHLLCCAGVLLLAGGTPALDAAKIF